MFSDRHFLIATFAFIGFGVSLLIHLLTFFGIDTAGSLPLVYGLQVLMFGPFIALVFSLNAHGRNHARHIGRLLAPMPWWAKGAAVLLFFYALFNFVYFLSVSGGGTADFVDGRYVLQTRGEFIRTLTADEYAWQKVYELRGISGHWMLFFLMPALYFQFTEPTLTAPEKPPE